MCDNRANSTGLSMSPKPELDKRDWIAGLEKGLTLLLAFDADHPRLTASQAGQRQAGENQEVAQ